MLSFLTTSDIAVDLVTGALLLCLYLAHQAVLECKHPVHEFPKSVVDIPDQLLMVGRVLVAFELE